MAGKAAFGTKFYKTSGTSSTAISYLTDLKGPKQSADDIDITDHDDSDGHREFVPGLVDAGEVELEMSWSPANIAVIHALWRTTASFKAVFPDSSSWAFDGYLKGLDGEAPFEDKIKANATFKCSGKPTFATN